MSDQTPLPPRRRQAGAALRRLAVRLALVGGVCCVLAGALWWIGGSDSGLRFLCSTLVELSGSRLQIESPGGRLLGSWHARSLRWRDAAREIELQQLSVVWSPGALAHGRLLFERVEADSLRVSTAPQSPPATLPDSLQLPLAVHVAQLRLGQLRLGEFGQSKEPNERGGPGRLLAEGIDAALSSDGRVHRLERLHARLGLLSLTGEATLAGQRPFAVQARAALAGAAGEQPFVLDLLGSGSLEQLQIDGRTGAAASGQSAGQRAPPAGELQAVLTPFAAQPLASLRLHLIGIDPAAIVAGAPRALLDVDARLDSPAPAGMRLRIANRQSGALDRQRLPVESLQATLDWRGARLAVDALALSLSGGGRLVGQGRLDGEQLALDLAAVGVNARALHGRLPPTRLSGPLRARLGIDRQQLDVDWRDARYALSARLGASPQAVEIERLTLTSGGAAIDLHGKLALTGEERFTAKGRLRQFDPARFVQSAAIPRSVINAEFDASGALRPALELALRFDLGDSRSGGQKLSGRGRVDLSGNRLRRVDVDLEAAGNRLHADGAFGRPGDALRVTLQAPRLEALGWPRLSGDARATLALSGSAASPELAGQLQVARLQLGSTLEIRDLTLDAQLAAGSEGALSGRLHCAACALPAAGIAALSVDASAEGVRSRHRLNARVGLPEKRGLTVALAGGLFDKSGRQSGPAWRGQLSELRFERRDLAGSIVNSVVNGAVSGNPNSVPGSAAGAALLALAAPAVLQVDAAALVFGPASFAGRLGALRIGRLGRQQGRWQSAGALQQLRVQEVLSEFPALQAWRELLGSASAEPLVLAGEWELALGGTPSGRVALRRERGDLLLGTLPLGLTDARLQATVGDGRVAASAHLSGQRLGEIKAELSALGGRAGKDEAPPLIDAQAPWQGSVQARVPDLAWLAPLLGPGWQLGGQLQGELRLAGSAARPQFSGQWRGDELAVRALDQGMRLERGQALLEITPERLLLRRLAFDSDFRPPPRELRQAEPGDVARLTARPGRLEASGELALAGAGAGGTARLGVRLDRVGVVQRPDQWLAVSGEAQLSIAERALEVDGKLRVDAGFWALAPAGRPRLSDDVVLRGAHAQESSRVQRALKLDLDVALGPSVYFRGAGVESRLAGALRIRSDDAGLPRATGSIRTVDGRFDAYGQKLAIERGIVNFQGAIDNPGLNLLAVRPNLPVEAGVEVTGTAQRPLIRLVSTPTVPDAEKLSWLVLGRSPEQRGGDSGLLLAAAQTILGGQDGGVLSKLQRALGIDDFSVSSGQLGGFTSLPTSRVASSTGFGGSQTVDGRIVSVGKRLSSNALLSYEQSLNTTQSIVKLTVTLSRQFSLVGRAGSESALDLFWNHSFGR